ncbi:MAG: putative Transcriptional regulator, PadR-like family [Promethearchaeota archaeon]|nr:MAG: putative Transcriptional regulator, PadR-like family [Candidatus Lokiarchaeota archaeon]
MAKYRPLEVFVLGLFNQFRRPMSGYELIKIAKDWRFDHYIEASSNASFYYTLKKFKKKGFIEEIGSEKEENRPEKTIYKLLPKGKREFFSQMDYFLNKVEDFSFNIDAVTPFILMYGLFKGKGTLTKAIEDQIDKREDIFEKIRSGKEYVRSHELSDLNPFQILALEHYKLHNEAEIEWLKIFLEMVKKVNFKQNIKEIAKRMNDEERE